ncbi:TIGR02391 family protein [Vibrio vulnificus]|uniref:TIGR02391 family protein n=1 Tax=Vibrio vulnificus TaxID=672 RepID=UPI0012ADAB79|nr:TIGR02391 family protein [Vibrio vulnificus]ELB2135082.1 hypothetical protein [Vibrio parahaemolyticus]HCG5490340.1 hypothetical protein [Vibrio parahaemolyticus]HCM1428330.1 hypothetical protein [Vibrio parahaemolyticus]
MSNETYCCNQCSKELPEFLAELNFCVNCGALTPSYKAVIVELFERSQMRGELKEAMRQFLKGEYASAARTATIILENVVKDLTDNDSMFGQDLMAQTLSFTYDQKTNELTKTPLIQLNDLSSRTKRNEQDGMKLLCMGLMAGCRNIFAHSSGHASPSDCLSIVMMVNFVIAQLTGGSLAEQLSKNA